MRAIILSAKKVPFCEQPPFSIEIMGNMLFDLQNAVFNNCGIDKIGIVVGYKHEELNADQAVIPIINDKWQSTESSYSLRLALQSFREPDDTLVVYGDTIFDPQIIKKMFHSPYDITICCKADPKIVYHEYSLIENGLLQRISSKRQEAFTVFTGLLYIKKEKVNVILPKLSEQTSIGEILNELVNEGENIITHIVDHGWHEINSRESLESVKSNHSLLHNILHIQTNWMQRSIKYNQLNWVNNDLLLQGIIKIIAKKKFSKILDVGTGSGKILRAAKLAFSNTECWGIDISENMLKKIPDPDKYTLNIADAENLLNLPNSYFDIATARMVFHHINNMDKAVAEIKKKLKPNGLFIICEGSPPSLRTIDWYTNMFKYKEKRHTLTEIDLINLFVKHGFNDISTKSIVIKSCSLNNWLNSSGIPDKNIKIIKKLHYEAPEYVKEDYNMKFIDNDCLMDWRFSITHGIIPK